MSNNNVPVKSKPEITQLVAERIQMLMQSGELSLPQNYNADNAIKSAYLLLQEVTDKNKKPALDVCTRTSISNALMEMVIQGLSPMKKQCAFIVRGDKLCCERQYQGTIALTKRLAALKHHSAHCIYEDDDFQYTVNNETGQIKVLKHDQSIENINMNKIKAAYAVLVFADDKPNHVEIMSMDQIRQAWQQSDNKGNSPAHKNFPDQMAKKTVINRACKLYIEGSDDSDIWDEEPRQPREVADDAQEISFQDEPEAEKPAAKPKPEKPDAEQAEAPFGDVQFKDDEPGF